jgi:hypothetical protein
VLLVLGLIAFARTRVPNVRIGRVGAALAVAGATLYVPAHVLSVIAHDAALEDPVAIVVLTLFGIGAVLTAIGMLMAGTAIRRSGAWTGWRGYTPLALGAWMVLMVPLQSTAALPVAVGGYALAVMALGVALIEAA